MISSPATRSSTLRNTLCLLVRCPPTTTLPGWPGIAVPGQCPGPKSSVDQPDSLVHRHVDADRRDQQPAELDHRLVGVGVGRAGRSVASPAWGPSWSWCSTWCVVVVVVVVVDVDRRAWCCSTSCRRQRRGRRARGRRSASTWRRCTVVVRGAGPCRRRPMPPHDASSSAGDQGRRQDGRAAGARSPGLRVTARHLGSSCQLNRSTGRRRSSGARHRGGGALAVGDAGGDADPAVAGAGERERRRATGVRPRPPVRDGAACTGERRPSQRVIETRSAAIAPPRWSARSAERPRRSRRRRRGAATGSPSRPSETRRICRPVRVAASAPISGSRTTRPSRAAAATSATR